MSANTEGIAIPGPRAVPIGIAMRQWWRRTICHAGRTVVVSVDRPSAGADPSSPSGVEFYLRANGWAPPTRVPLRGRRRAMSASARQGLARRGQEADVRSDRIQVLSDGPVERTEIVRLGKEAGEKNLRAAREELGVKPYP